MQICMYRFLCVVKDTNVQERPSFYDYEARRATSNSRSSSLNSGYATCCDASAALLLPLR